MIRKSSRNPKPTLNQNRLKSARKMNQLVKTLTACTTFTFLPYALAEVVDLQLTLDGMQEVPEVVTAATGMGTATLDKTTLEFSWNVSYSNLEGTPTAAHFHGPAPVCQTGPIIITLPFQSPIIGSATVTQQQAQDILAGNWYINVHSDLHPSGEIRGQVEPVPLDNPIPTPIPLGDRVRLTTIATGLTAPNWGASAPGINGRLFVTDQDGIVWNIDLNDGTKSIFLDVQSRLVPLGIFGQDTFDERGLLGLAFHPNYATNGLLYTYTSEPFDPNHPGDFSTMPPGVDPNHQSVIAEWHVQNPTDPNATVDQNSIRILMRIDEPQFNHNGGSVNFGPDGMMYVSLGDGGQADDQNAADFFGGPALGHGCDGNGRDRTTILGSLIRIDPQGNNSANGSYGIPADNPFVGENAVEEIFAYGLRNPFRASFDQATGDFYVADTGQNHVEELNVVQSGDNFGWNVMEGTFRFVRNGASAGYAASAEHIDTTGITMPIAEYDHDEGIAIIGGFVYRGSDVPSLNGRYLFGDFAQTFQNDGRVFYLTPNDEIKEFDLAGGVFGRSLLGFGQDANGEVYILGNGTGVPFGSTGEVLRIDPPLSLELAGECPGRVTATVKNAVPGRKIAFLRASGRGSVKIPNGFPCAETTLGLNQTVTLVRVVNANGNGVASIAGPVGANACGKVLLQAVELSNSQNCAVSNVVTVQ